VKSFVAAHGGTIAASSDGEGKGSVFIIKLPRAIAAREETGKEESGRAQEHKKNRVRILIVEDEADTLEMLTAHFRAQNYEVFPCGSAAEALEVAGREHLDVLISDIAMPTMDGLELIRQLRKLRGLEGLPALALTGYASEKDAEAAIAAGFNVHYPKPTDPVELAATIESLLAADQNRPR
jgi:CheY-like chemotaxis protein